MVARRVDPPRLPSIDEVIEPDAPTELLDEAQHPIEVPELEDFRPLWDWAESWGQDDEAGEEIRRCALEYEPKLQGPCQWADRFVVRRAEDGETGRLVAARLVFVEGAYDEMCRAFARCELLAIVAHRTEVPLPSDAPSELAFAMAGRSSMWDPSMEVDRVTYYRALLDDQKGYLADLEAAISDSPGGVSAESEDWNLSTTAHTIRELERMLELIEES